MHETVDLLRCAVMLCVMCVFMFRHISCFHLLFRFGKSFCWNMHIPFACKCNSSNGIVHIKHEFFRVAWAKAVKTVKSNATICSTGKNRPQNINTQSMPVKAYRNKLYHSVKPQ